MLFKYCSGARYRFIFILIIIIATVLYFLTFSPYFSLILFSSVFDASYLLSSSMMKKNEDNQIINSNVSQNIIILTWTQLWGKPFPSDSLTRCRNFNVTNKCTMVNDTKLLNKSSAVIFHANDISYANMPPFKPDGTKFVFLTNEPPEKTFIPLIGLPIGYFDWTFTHRTDSDIYCPYGYIEQSAEPLDSSWMEYATNKTKLVAWYVSMCQSDSKREFFAYELKKHITVDIFGRCGKQSCPMSNWSICNDYLHQYKFYLSFESSICKDYITEKFYDRLNAYIVPIVLQRSAYVNIAPNKSFIAMDDFPTPKDLATYLLYLDKNQDEYMKYFSWRKEYNVVTELKMSRYCFCDLCEKLWNEKSSQVVDNKISKREKLDIHKWWYVDGACDHKYADKLLTKNRRSIFTAWLS